MVASCVFFYKTSWRELLSLGSTIRITRLYISIHIPRACFYVATTSHVASVLISVKLLLVGPGEGKFVGTATGNFVGARTGNSVGAM